MMKLYSGGKRESMHPNAELFRSIGEPFAQGLFEEPGSSFFHRYCTAYTRWFEALRPAEYEAGETLYPCGDKYFRTESAVTPQFALTYSVDWNALAAKSPEAERLMRGFWETSHCPGGWTHFAPNYKRIVREGLDSYRERALCHKGSAFHADIAVLLDAVQGWLERSTVYLRGAGAPERMVRALEQVPFKPARDCYEGLIAWNVIFYLDGADNLGIPDDGLADLFDGGDYTGMLAQMFTNIDRVGTWSCTIGPKCNGITRQALRAIRGHRRPMLELRVDENTPDDVWELAVEDIRSGCSHPSFYNDRGIHDMLHERFPQIPDEELALFCGCGCTETNLQGITRAGGTDGDVPLLRIFEKYMTGNLTKAPDFETFYEGVCRESEAKVHETLDKVAEWYRYMGERLPNPMRTIFCDDCIDNGKDYNAGGARYTYAETSESGLINVIDSLLAIRELVFEKKRYTAEEFLRLLKVEDPLFGRVLRQCACYGTDDERSDTLARDYAGRVYSAFRSHPPKYFVEAFLLTEHQFLRYQGAGKDLGPTPDGRKHDEPTCDSIAAIRGKAKRGPTAMLNSASRLPQHLADGISVLNLTLQKDFVGENLRALVETYFEKGGIQVQVTCTSPEELEDAYRHPEKHRDLIVRVGGYSDYYINLTPELRKAVYERDVHSL